MAILADVTQDAVMIQLARSHSLLQARSLHLVCQGDDVKAGDIVAVISDDAIQTIWRDGARAPGQDQRPERRRNPNL